MAKSQTLGILIIITVLSCNPPEKSPPAQSASNTVQIAASDTARQILPVNGDTSWPAEGLPSFTVDDYPLTNAMLGKEARHRVSGEIIDGEGAWFSNDSLDQTLVFLLYTDYHRLVTYHFLNSDISPGIIERMELHEGGELASFRQKQKHFKGFLPQSKKISRSYFTSDKGFNLGDSKDKALNVYGKPDKRQEANGIERYDWEFIGDYFYEKTMDRKGKPLARDSFGHQVTMFFRNNKLIGVILHNDIP